MLSNTEKTFQNSYVAQHIPVDLMQVNFGKARSRGGKDMDELFTLLRQISLKADERAPIHLSEQEVAALDDRKDLQELRASLAKAKSDTGAIRESPEARRISLRYQYIRRVLQEQAVKEKRKKYFDEADKCRALGQHPPIPLEADSRDDYGSTRVPILGLGIRCMSEFLQRSELGSKKRDQHFVDMLVEFLSHRFANLDCILAELDAASRGAPIPTFRPILSLKGDYRCLFCCLVFKERHTISKHVENYHEPSFATSFYYPECRRSGKEPARINSLSEWVIYTGRIHGS